MGIGFPLMLFTGVRNRRYAPDHPFKAGSPDRGGEKGNAYIKVQHHPSSTTTAPNTHRYSDATVHAVIPNAHRFSDAIAIFPDVPLPA